MKDRHHNKTEGEELNNLKAEQVQRTEGTDAFTLLDLLQD